MNFLKKVFSKIIGEKNKEKVEVVQPIQKPTDKKTSEVKENVIEKKEKTEEEIISEINSLAFLKQILLK